MLHSSELFADVMTRTPESLLPPRRERSSRRNLEPKDIFAAGILSGGGLDQPIPCKVVNYSDFGVRLQFAPEAARDQFGRILRPSEMKLLIVAERSEAECAILWRSSHHMGVRLKCALRRKPLAA
jgi:hypothetical protein